MVYVRTEPKTRVERFPKILNRYVTIKKLSIAENRKKKRSPKFNQESS